VIIVDCNPNMEGPASGSLPGRSIANNTAPLVKYFRRANGLQIYAF